MPSEALNGGFVPAENWLCISTHSRTGHQWVYPVIGWDFNSWTTSEGIHTNPWPVLLQADGDDSEFNSTGDSCGCSHRLLRCTPDQYIRCVNTESEVERAAIVRELGVELSRQPAVEVSE